MTRCPHPEDRRFAWTYCDPRQDGNYIAMCCCVCGAVLVGGADMQGNDVGPQHRLSPNKRKRKQRGE